MIRRKTIILSNILRTLPVCAFYTLYIPDHIPYYRRLFPVSRTSTVLRDTSCNSIDCYDVKISTHRRILACTYSRESAIRKSAQNYTLDLHGTSCKRQMLFPLLHFYINRNLLKFYFYLIAHTFLYIKIIAETLSFQHLQVLFVIAILLLCYCERQINIQSYTYLGIRWEEYLREPVYILPGDFYACIGESDLQIVHAQVT